MPLFPFIILRVVFLCMFYHMKPNAEEPPAGFYYCYYALAEF